MNQQPVVSLNASGGALLLNLTQLVFEHRQLLQLSRRKEEEAYFVDYIPPARDAITLPRNVVYVLVGVVLVIVATYAIVGHLIKDLMHDLAGNPWLVSSPSHHSFPLWCPCSPCLWVLFVSLSFRAKAASLFFPFFPFWVTVSFDDSPSHSPWGLCAEVNLLNCFLVRPLRWMSKTDNLSECLLLKKHLKGVLIFYCTSTKISRLLVSKTLLHFI